MQNQNKSSSFTKIVEIPILKINIGKYQKQLNMARCKKIADEFDINRMRPIEVSFRNGKYWCFDGQHRINAYKLMGKNTIPCIIHLDLTYEDEAYLFARQQENVGAVQAHHRWNALVEAKDQYVLDIVAIAKAQGFTILHKNNKPNNIKCVKAIQTYYNDLGELAFASGLRVIAQAWEFSAKSTDHDIISGLYLFSKAYKGIFDYSRLTDRLSLISPTTLLRNAKDNFSVQGDARKVAVEILRQYNKGSRAKRLPPSNLGVVIPSAFFDI